MTTPAYYLERVSGFSTGRGIPPEPVTRKLQFARRNTKKRKRHTERLSEFCREVPSSLWLKYLRKLPKARKEPLERNRWKISQSSFRIWNRTVKWRRLMIHRASH
jgi:hypothetical protein